MKELIEKFYTSLRNLDADGMVDCYHPEIVFTDPAFGTLAGEKAKAMWRMLCESQKGKDFKVDFTKVSADEDKGSAQWQAHYTFSKTGRKVHNTMMAHFKFKDGLIINHTDKFNLHTWAKQALGFKGWLLGSTSFFQKQLQRQTNGMLERFIAKQNK